MYRVKIFDGPDDTTGITIHSPHFNGQKLSSGVVKDEINKIDSFDFSFEPDNVAHGHLKPYFTLIHVQDTLKDEYIFEGRIYKPKREMDNNGLLTSSWLAEGELGYLHDGMQRHLEFRGTPFEAVKTILDYFNTQVEDYKHFQVGNIEVTNSTNNLYFYLSAEQDTFDALKEKILDSIGGELQIRKENGIRYLDILNSIGELKETEINLDKNLISMSVDIDPTDIITRFTPLGTRIESEDESATDASQARLTIESVNDGLPYIDSQILIDQFGIQGGSVTWDDINQPSILKTTGQNYMDNQKLVLNQYSIKAYDLSIIGLVIDNFKKGNSHRLVNPVMNIDEVLRIIGTSKDIIEIEESGITIGDKFKSSYEFQADTNRSSAKIGTLEAELISVNRKVNEKVQDINNQIITLNQTLNESDLPAMTQAIEDLNEAIVDLNLVVEGIPNYGLATITQSGLMPPEDKQKADYLTVTSPTDLDALKNKSDLITVIEAIDLDDIVLQIDDLQTRVQTLENGGVTDNGGA